MCAIFSVTVSGVPMSFSRARTPKPNICLVQPHPLALREFSQQLSASYRIFVVQDCKAVHTCGVSNASELIFIFDKATITLPISLCLEALRHLCPEPKAILLAQASSPEEQFQLLSLGVKGIILYKDVLDQLIPAVLSVTSGGYWLSREVLAQYARRSPRNGLGNADDLTSREAEVLKFLKQRFSNKEIGLRLVLSESTVKFHISNIFAKLGVHDRVSVVDLLEIANQNHDAPRPPTGNISSTVALPDRKLPSTAAMFPVRVRNGTG
jgi:DNA-binding NarL/FixJ family response regulator